MSRERFRNLTEITSDWIWEIDKNGFYNYASPKIYDILGYDPEEIIGLTPFDLMPPAEADRVFKIFKNIHASQKPFHCLENINLHKNGHPVVLETSGVPTFDADGKFTGYRGVDRDITQRKRIEDELRKAHDELESKVAERTRELKIQKSNLEETNIALQVLLEKRQEDKIEIAENVMTNVKELLAPYFIKIKKTNLDNQQKTFLSIMESNLNEIISPFTRKMSLKYLNLTPTEIHVANLIRHGSNSKEIAELMNLSARTIYNHRKNIRKKLGLGNKRTNLRSYLLSIY
jgi:PAS domain S-box-containing protein